MSLTLHVDAARWRAGLSRTLDAQPTTVPVIKGNGYGFGRGVLAREATALGVDTIAVGTYAEVPAALTDFGSPDGDVLVLSPWRPFDDPDIASQGLAQLPLLAPFEVQQVDVGFPSPPARPRR